MGQVEFQSLLSWISRFGRRIAVVADGGIEFQSLLSWISRFGPPTRARADP